MTKKEQALVAELKKQLALSWPRYEKPQPKDLTGVTYREREIGWFSSDYGLEYRVSLGCSNGVHHSRDRTDRTSTQGMGVMYQTKLDALKVARHGMSERFAAALAAIDAEIQAAMEAQDEAT